MIFEVKSNAFFKSSNKAEKKFQNNMSLQEDLVPNPQLQIIRILEYNIILQKAKKANNPRIIIKEVQYNSGKPNFMESPAYDYP